VHSPEIGYCFSMNIPGKSIWKAATLLALGATLVLVSSCGQPGDAGVHEAASPYLRTLTTANFRTEVLSSSEPVLVDFWASWCGPCKIVAPTVAAIADEYQGRVKVGKVDIDAEPALARDYSISAIPTLLIFKDGKKVEELVGVQTRETLKASLDKLVAGGAAKPTP
jgi:thioredoxin